MKSMLKVIGAVALTSVMVLPVLADDATATTDAKDQKDLRRSSKTRALTMLKRPRRASRSAVMLT